VLNLKYRSFSGVLRTIARDSASDTKYGLFSSSMSVCDISAGPVEDEWYGLASLFDTAARHVFASASRPYKKPKVKISKYIRRSFLQESKLRKRNLDNLEF
jgi:hypothetical protein